MGRGLVPYPGYSDHPASDMVPEPGMELCIYVSDSLVRTPIHVPEAVQERGLHPGPVSDGSGVLETALCGVASGHMAGDTAFAGSDPYPPSVCDMEG